MEADLGAPAGIPAAVALVTADPPPSVNGTTGLLFRRRKRISTRISFSAGCSADTEELV